MEIRSHCPTNFGLEHFGDKWTLLIIRDLMFKGKRHYNEFLSAEENVSTSVLGSRLRDLQAAGIITKGTDAVKKSRIRYSLTQKGIDLLPLMVEIIAWSDKYDKETAAPAEFLEVVAEDRDKYISQKRIELAKSHLD